MIQNSFFFGSSRVSPRQFQKGAVPFLPFHRMKSALAALHLKIAPFLPFSKKKRERMPFNDVYLHLKYIIYF